MLDALIETGLVDLSVTNKQGHTAATLAEMNRYPDIAFRLAALAQVTPANDVATQLSTTTTSSSVAPLDDDGDEHAQSLDDYKCPVSRMIFFQPVAPVSCGHAIESDYLQGENGCNKLDNCPLCRKPIVYA